MKKENGSNKEETGINKKNIISKFRMNSFYPRATAVFVGLVLVGGVTSAMLMDTKNDGSDSKQSSVSKEDSSSSSEKNASSSSSKKSEEEDTKGVIDRAKDLVNNGVSGFVEQTAKVDPLGVGGLLSNLGETRAEAAARDDSVRNSLVPVDVPQVPRGNSPANVPVNLPENTVSRPNEPNQVRPDLPSIPSNDGNNIVEPLPEPIPPVLVPEPDPITDYDPADPEIIYNPLITISQPTRIVHVGETVNPFSDVSAYDAFGSDLTNLLSYQTNLPSGNRVTEEGTYQINYLLKYMGYIRVASRTIVVINDAPVINGSTQQTVTWGNTDFDISKVITATDTEEGNLTVSFINTHFDATKSGDYIFTARAADGYGKSTTRTITVSVGKPDVHLTTESDSLILNEAFDPMENVSASATGLSFDLELISGEVDTANVGEYELTYKATYPANGENVLVKRTVKVDATTPELEGVEDISIDQGSIFDPLDGVKVIDHHAEGGIGVPEVAGEVNTDVPGKYVLTYSYTNGFGKKVEQERIIIVNGIRDTETISEDIETNSENENISGEEELDIPKMSGVILIGGDDEEDQESKLKESLFNLE